MRRGAKEPQAGPAPQGIGDRLGVPSSPSRMLEAAASLVRPAPHQQELICSAIGLSIKLGLSLVAAVSLVRLAGAYQERLDRAGEIAAVLDIQRAKLLKAQDHFDRLFAQGGEQRLIQEQDQWIAPNRLRVVWDYQGRKASAGKGGPFPTVEQSTRGAGN